jgi:hypothetical protein
MSGCGNATLEGVSILTWLRRQETLNVFQPTPQEKDPFIPV